MGGKKQIKSINSSIFNGKTKTWWKREYKYYINNIVILQ